MDISPVKVWRNQNKIRSYLGRTGTVESFTLVHVPPVGFSDQAPYPVVLVVFENGEKLVGQLVDCEKGNIKTGSKVQAVLRRIKKPDLEGVIPYGVKFKRV